MAPQADRMEKALQALSYVAIVVNNVDDRVPVCAVLHAWRWAKSCGAFTSCRRLEYVENIPRGRSGPILPQGAIADLLPFN